MLPKVFNRTNRAKKVRILADNSVIIRGNVSQVYRPETWR